MAGSQLFKLFSFYVFYGTGIANLLCQRGGREILPPVGCEPTAVGFGFKERRPYPAVGYSF